ncbi:leukotriene C4 synthase [Gadus chalcogrammus]|uniref:leukotriene C4 synthase n=1 Tax=Gadus chalcogrammus TaxID=1042646 RepID=UPI0024C4C5E9|nr:leukotriene C4 synthase [Gadus chalcogrammus]
MTDHLVGLGAVSLLAVMEQVYFSLQVVYARRKYSVTPPSTSGPPEFERLYRAQVNCTEYFPIFITLLWTSGLFFHPGVSTLCGLLYLYSRYRYFSGYCQSSRQRLAPLYFGAKVLWALIGFSSLGVLGSFSRLYAGVDLVDLASSCLIPHAPVDL